MHTFFINTSKKSLDEYNVLFDIHYENRALVTLNYPMSDWYDKENGYVSCVEKMSDMIDGYVELNNAFNLIIYIDLSENKAYSSIKRDAFHDKDREACLSAMHILFTHVISGSLVELLANSGRKPREVLIMFGEDRKFTDFNVSATDPGRPLIMKELFSFIGLPEPQVTQEIAKSVDASTEADKEQQFKNKILAQRGGEIVPGIMEGYNELISLWCDEVINEANVEKANEALFDRINDVNRMEAERMGIESVSCPYDCYACTVNKSQLALSRLNIALYTLKCVEAASIYGKREGSGTQQGKVMDFYAYTAEEVAPMLKAKADAFRDKVSDIQSLQQSYPELKLAPELQSFDYAKFGLDEFGDKLVELVITENEDAPLEEAQEGETIEIKGNDKKVDIVEKEGRPMFSKEEYEPFDYKLDIGDDQLLGKHVKPEKYIEQAKLVKKHHLDYLKRLKIHTSKALSNYAGKSKENKPALLQVGGYRYAKPGREDKVLEAVETVSDKAYETMLNRYMEFCAGRSVEITDIDEQCDWFVTRIYQIRDSLSRIRYVAVGLLFAILLLYIPFIIIQFESITENAIGLAVALVSILIPAVLLYGVFAFTAAAQRKKYLKAWQDFKERSDDVLEKNAVAAKKFDQLLSSVVPALRWVYEYKLDVDYCVECCSVADAKIEHHRKKLLERITGIENILSDLEYISGDREDDYELEKDTIDFNVSFCTGKQNKKFYSVIDGRFLLHVNN